MEFTRRIKQSCNDENHGRQRPLDGFFTFGHMLVQELVKLELLDDFQREPRATELTTILNANGIGIDLSPSWLNGFVFVFKEGLLF